MSRPENRYARAKEIFFDACDLAPERRGAFLDEACGGDAELRADVESLLANHDENEADGWEPATMPFCCALRGSLPGSIDG